MQGNNRGCCCQFVYALLSAIADNYQGVTQGTDKVNSCNFAHKKVRLQQPADLLLSFNHLFNLLFQPRSSIISLPFGKRSPPIGLQEQCSC